MTDVATIRFLSRERCLELLGEATIGRVAVTRDGVPHVVPVNFGVLDGTVVFRSGTGTKHDAALADQPVSFEVDRIDEDAHTGWSVLVSGTARVITDPDVLARVDDLGVVAWAPGGRHEVIRVEPQLVSGREIVPD